MTQLWLPPGRPLLAAALRILPAGLVLLLWVRALHRGAWWGRAALLGALNHGVFFARLYLAAVAGIAGVVLLVRQNGRAGSVDLLAVGASVGAVTSASVGFVLLKRWIRPGEVLVTTSWQLVAGGIVLVPVAPLVEGAPPALDLPAVLGLAWLGWPARSSATSCGSGA